MSLNCSNPPCRVLFALESAHNIAQLGQLSLLQTPKRLARVVTIFCAAALRRLPLPTYPDAQPPSRINFAALTYDS